MGKHTAVGGGRPLVVTSDERLLDELLRLAAAAGVEVDTAPDTGLAKHRWAEASIVVVDDELVDSMSALGLPRRAAVIVVGRDLDDSVIWRRALGVGAEHVVFLPEAAPWLVEQFGRPIEQADQARVVTVLSASGGVGASTFAAALATCGVGRGLAPVLVDADPWGGGIDLLLGGEEVSGVRWPDLASTEGRLDGATLLEALPEYEGLRFLSWSQSVADELDATTYDSVLSALARDDRLVIVDLGRGAGVFTDLVLDVTSTGVLLVPARVRAVAAASGLVRRLEHRRSSLALVVRRPAPGGLDDLTIARALDLPLAGTLPHDGRRAEWEDTGVPLTTKGSWRRVADAVLDLPWKSDQAA